jgi:3-hydroxybutyryl-CoA dehydrogenase
MHVISANDVRAMAVLGAGTMGNGIAQVAAAAGISVTLCDLDQGVLDKAMTAIRGNLDKGVSLGKLAAEARDATLARLATATQIEPAVSKADVVVEAVPEKLELKRTLFARVTAAAPAHALLATNTSSLPIAQIADATPQPERIVGMHFFNPVHLMKLVEVVHHARTPLAVIHFATQLSERLGKTPIVVRDSPGFASSRLGIAIGIEAMRMVEENVATPADIDTAMKLGYGHPMGPLELTDLVGLDVRHSIAEYLAGVLGERFAPPRVLSEKVAAGKLGKKSGEGFYRWVDGKKV